MSPRDFAALLELFPYSEWELSNPSHSRVKAGWPGKEKVMDTLQKLAKGALTAQNASNLSGVVHSMSQTMESLWAHAHEQGKGTEWVNTHPISVLYSAQVAHLSSGSMTATAAYSVAYNACKSLAG